jgi:polar amino acid transport system substrate-binding protein
VLNTVPTLSIVLRDKPGTFSMVENVGGNNWHGYGFRKEDTELGKFVDERIEAMKQSGEIYTMQEKWFGFKMKLSDAIPSFG